MGKYKKEKYIIQRQNKSGWSFQVVIRNGDKTITKTFNSSDYGSDRKAYDQAVMYKNSLLNDIAMNKYFPTVNMKLSDLFHESEELSNYNLKTKVNHQSLFNQYIEDISISGFDAEFVIVTLNKLVYKCTDDTIARVFSILKNMDRTAILKKYYFSPVTIGLSAPASKLLYQKKKTKTTDIETVRALYNICDKSIKGIIAVAYYTGMRPSEIFALNKDDIKDGFITINKMIGSSDEDIGVIRNTKNKSSTRVIPISPYLNELLANYDEDILFPDKYGNYYSAKSFYSNTVSKFKRYNFNLYMLRHMFATTLEYAGVDRITLDALMGHSARNSTDIYVHTTAERMKEAVLNIPPL